MRGCSQLREETVVGQPVIIEKEDLALKTIKLMSAHCRGYGPKKRLNAINDTDRVAQDSNT